MLVRRRSSSTLASDLAAIIDASLVGNDDVDGGNHIAKDVSLAQIPSDVLLV